MLKPVVRFQIIWKAPLSTYINVLHFTSLVVDLFIHRPVPAPLVCVLPLHISLSLSSKSSLTASQDVHVVHLVVFLHAFCVGKPDYHCYARLVHSQCRSSLGQYPDTRLLYPSFRSQILVIVVTITASTVTTAFRFYQTTG